MPACVDTLVAAEEELFGSYRGERSIEQVDKQRLGIYYAIDWIVQREQESFAFDELLAASRRLSRLIAPVDEAAPGQLQHVIDVLERAEYLERVEPPVSTVAGVKVGPAPVRYRLPRRRLLELGAFLGVFEQEAQALFRAPAGPGVVPPAPVASAAAPAAPTERYSRTRQLAMGGMSSVHLARDLLTGRDVVIKQLNAHLAADASLRGRAVREGRVLAAFTHPGTVKVLDVLEQDESISIVMEYVSGPALDEVLKHGPVVDMAIANRLMHDILAALAYVHEQRVIWRDPKPANVLVTPEGRVVLIDFGVARVEGAADTTDVGTVIGTLGYMSPEQLRGEPIGWQSDIFGLGALFYEVLTGRKLFTGTLPEVIGKSRGAPHCRVRRTPLLRPHPSTTSSPGVCRRPRTNVRPHPNCCPHSRQCWRPPTRLARMSLGSASRRRSARTWVRAFSRPGPAFRRGTPFLLEQTRRPRHRPRHRRFRVRPHRPGVRRRRTYKLSRP